MKKITLTFFLLLTFPTTTLADDFIYDSHKAGSIMKKMMECLGISIALILLGGCCCVSIPPLGGINSKFNKINKNNTYITNDVNIASKPQGGT